MADQPEYTDNIPGNITAVGAFVVRNESVLVVRLTYGPTEGRYSLPGGWQDVGEELDTAAVREVREETGVEARCVGMIGMRTRTDRDPERTIVDLMWLLEHERGEPRPSDGEADDARFMPFDEVLERDDVEEIVTWLVNRYREGSLHPFCLVGPNADETDQNDEKPEVWKLFA